MGSTRTRMLLLWSAVFLAVFSTSSAQESNFGKKVKCYLQDGTVVCPGCNYRAGLLCPRFNNMGSCNVQTEYPKVTSHPITQVYEDETKPTSLPITQISEDEPKLTTIKETQDVDTKNVTTEITPFGEFPQEEIEYWSQKARENLQFRLFLYSILRGKRWRREVQDDDTCRWNGDCPCPLICCNGGDGCPKRCVKGIRLPPPWG